MKYQSLQSMLVPTIALQLIPFFLGTAIAQDAAPAKAWLWAHDPFATTYKPLATFSYNSGGSPNSILGHAGRGEWDVEFAGLGAPSSVSGVFHVSPYGGNHMCNVSGTGSVGSSLRARIHCFDHNGAPVDGKFTILFQRQSSTSQAPGAYLHSSGTGSLNQWVAVGPASSWNSTGDTNSVMHSGLGAYVVKLPGMTAGVSHVMITSLNSSLSRCQPLSWNPIVGGTQAYVRCTTPAGLPMDSDFYLSYISQPNLNIGPVESFGAFLWAHNPTADNYIPSAAYSASTGTAPTRIRRASAGEYLVTLPGLPASDTSTAIVSAYSSTNYCNVHHWVPVGGNTELDVVCFNATGSPADTLFTVFYTGVSPKVIDSFDTGAAAISLHAAGETTVAREASVPGGIRTIRQVLTKAGTSPLSEIVVNPSARPTCGSGSVCRTEIVYGRDGAGNFVPLNLNLSDRQQLRLQVDRVTGVLTSAIVVYWANATQYATSGININAAGEIHFDLSTFVPGSTVPVNWADIDYIAVVLEQSGANTAQIRSFTAQ